MVGQLGKLAIVFGKQVKQDDFKDFFLKKLASVQELTFTNSTSAGRKIILIKESLNNIKIYHYIESNLQIKQYHDTACLWSSEDLVGVMALFQHGVLMLSWTSIQLW